MSVKHIFEEGNFSVCDYFPHLHFKTDVAQLLEKVSLTCCQKQPYRLLRKKLKAQTESCLFEKLMENLEVIFCLHLKISRVSIFLSVNTYVQHLEVVSKFLAVGAKQGGVSRLNQLTVTLLMPVGGSYSQIGEVELGDLFDSLGQNKGQKQTTKVISSFKNS